ncbi:hypothetical protein NQ315_006278 [Exocentrus adspersus]|uniref:Uncharacterized protein n=1 Tax=Exocentrus adspersus TaxID=1586481 RepID=A0AAV8VZJ1_9CUCU|nr:hypothetical protein NQ315_006278 [Exocentrus adspersus]
MLLLETGDRANCSKLLQWQTFQPQTLASVRVMAPQITDVVTFLSACFCSVSNLCLGFEWLPLKRGDAKRDQNLKLPISELISKNTNKTSVTYTHLIPKSRVAREVNHVLFGAWATPVGGSEPPDIEFRDANEQNNSNANPPLATKPRKVNLYTYMDSGPYEVYLQNKIGLNVGNYNHLAIAKEIFNLKFENIQKITKKREKPHLRRV